MTELSDSLREEADAQVASPHYLKTVTRLGDRRALVTSQEIFSSIGIKLVNKGASFNSKLYDQLAQHKLIPSIDQCVSIDDPVSAEGLATQVRDMLASDPCFALLADRFPHTDAIVQTIARIPFNPVIVFKLSVMRDTRPELMKHSLFVSVVSTYIGIRAGLPEAQLTDLACAGLLHDIGTLHIDPKLLERGHVLTDRERRHLYAHPVTAYLILEAFPEYDRELLKAVLDHHERLDGSGYPRGLHAPASSRLGQIVSVAEVVGSRLERADDPYGNLRLETILKLNSRRYGREYIGYLHLFYARQTDDEPACPPEKRELMRKRIRDISRVLDSWDRTYSSFRGSHPVVAFIDDLMSDLLVAVQDAGFDPKQAAAMALSEDDPNLCVEMGILADEAFWRVKEILQEILRRWPLLELEDSASDLHSVTDWLLEVKSLTR